MVTSFPALHFYSEGADRLKGRGKPHGALAGGRLVEEPLATLLGGAQLGRAVAWLGHHLAVPQWRSARWRKFHR